MKGMHLADQSCSQHGYQHAQPGIACLQRDAVAAHGADQHHALNTQVHHPRTLGENLADGSKQAAPSHWQRRPEE